jgi:VWFA-related protein
MRSMKCCRKTAKRVRLRRGSLGFIPLLFLFSLSTAQETTLRSQSNLVLVPALVKDAKGEIVYGLEAKDFLVEDDGVEQSVRLDEAPEGQPVSLVVAIQRGRRANFEFSRMEGLNTMLGPVFASGAARVALVEFDSQIGLAQDFTNDAALIGSRLNNLQPGDDGARILDAVNYSVDLLQKEVDDRLRVLLLISELHDHGSHMKIEDAVSSIGQANAVMYALAFSPGRSNILDTARGTNTPGSDKNEMHPGVNFIDLAYRTAQAMRKNVPSTVAQMSGGEYELFTTRKKFEMRMTDFSNHLHSRYLLSFTPKNPHPGLHPIRVRLKDSKDAVVLARTSYWAQGSR